MQDEIDYICCAVCGKQFKRISPRHLKYKHDGMTTAQYRELYPDSPMECKAFTQSKYTWKPGRIPWSKGRKMPPEVGAKISAKLKGRPKPPRTAEHSRRISESNRGKPQPRTPKLIAAYEAKRGKKMPPGQAEKLRQINLGKRHSEETKKKISQNRRGITPKRTPEGIANMPRGEKHYLWKGGVNPEYGGDWPKIAHSIRLRDQFNCQFCGKHSPKNHAYPVHHIIPVRDLQERDIYAHAPENLVTLCWSHHKTAESHMDWSVPFYRALLIGKYGYGQEFYDNLDAKLRDAV